MNANQKYYTVISVREAREILRQARFNAKAAGHKPGSKESERACVSLRMRGATDVEATRGSNGELQVNWLGTVGSCIF